MKILITGGCGFVGFNLATFLVGREHQVTVFDNLVRRGSETNVFGLRKKGVDFVHGDVRNLEDFSELSNDFDCLIECSAQPSVVSGYTNPVLDFRTNVTGVINCLEFCRRSETGMIFLSSSRVYPADKINALPVIEIETRWEWDPGGKAEPFPLGFNPSKGISAEFTLDGRYRTIYGASKASADFFCREYADAFNLNIIVNRCGVIAGQGQFGVVDQGWLTFWAMSCYLNRPVSYYGHKGKQVRDILFIEDLCRLIEIQLAKINNFSGCVWNVGGGRDSSLSLVEATSLMERLTNRKMAVHLKENERKGDVVIYITDNTKVSEELNWYPATSLEEGATHIVKWIADSKDRLIGAGL